MGSECRRRSPRAAWVAFCLFAFFFASSARAAVTCGPLLDAGVEPTPLANEDYVAVIDGYSSGNLIAPKLRERGAEPIHILTSENIPPDILASFKADDFRKELRWAGADPEAILRRLQRFRPRFVMAGSETGVPLADWLNEKLGLLGNGTQYSSARRDKYLMQQRLADAGVRSIRQFVTDDLDVLLRDAAQLGKIVVVKPLESAGTDGVFFTKNDEDRRRAFREIMGSEKRGGTGKPNAYGLVNRAVLVQEYLEGPEYMVDTVAMNGRLRFTDAALYEKTNANGSDAVYLGAKFVRYRELVDLGIVQYLEEVHRALGIHDGPGHAEVKIVERDGKKVPVLVEIGARLAGGGIPVMVGKANGKSQLDYWLDRLFAPEQFEKELETPYQFRPARMVCLLARKAGMLASYPYLPAIEALSTFSRFRVRVQPGQWLPLTTNFLNLPGHFEIIGEDDSARSDEVVDRHARWISEWNDRDDFYLLAPEARP